MKRKSFVCGLSGVVVALLFLTMGCTHLAQASTTPLAAGSGWFIHEHEGMTCRHVFGFSVHGGVYNDGWYYLPEGHLNLDCKNPVMGICMKVNGYKSWRFRVEAVEGGWNVVVEGWASVNIGSGWEDCWWFRLEAYDYGEPGNGVDVFQIRLWDPNHWSGSVPNLGLNPPEGQHHCDGTLNGGNIQVFP